MSTIQYIDRISGETKTELVYSDLLLQWCYNSISGSLLRELILTRKCISVVYGLMQDTRMSSHKITGFIKEMNIDITEFKDPPDSFQTFNDFFIRKLTPESRPINTDPNTLISPGDGKLLAFKNVKNNTVFMIKGCAFSLDDLVQQKKIMNFFTDPSVYILRLCPTDYHRFHFPADGKIVYCKKIKGEYYSVSPFALRKNINVFCRNRRTVSFLKTTAGPIAFIEVGAFGVGHIDQTFSNRTFKKGDEKGYFKFGGSSIIMITNGTAPDEDILRATAQGLETQVLFGEQIGVY